MESIPGLDDLAWIMALAAIAPILVGLLPAPRPPEVVLLLIGGMVLGPFILNVVTDTEAINLIVQIGLGFLFFFAGYEIDTRLLKEPPGKLAAIAWTISIVIALTASIVATKLGYVHATVPVAIAMTTTALGTLTPILNDTGLAKLPLGKYVVANGALGEFAPLLAISLFLGTSGLVGAVLALLIVGAVAGITVLLPRRAGQRIGKILDNGAATSSQTFVRWSVVLLLVLLAVAMRFGLDIVIGAFAAGIVLRIHNSQGALDQESRAHLVHKLEGIGFGFFVPVFFVASGITLDLGSILAEPSRMLTFFVAILLVRGLPAFFVHTKAVPDIWDRTRLMLYTATGLPVIIAITTIGISSGVMTKENAAALVGAGVLTVLFFPLLAEIIGRVRPSRPAPLTRATAA
jgi:Kef-type K+ transport system membrane component KefB